MPMTCAEAKARLNTTVEAEIVELGDHFATCEQCRKEGEVFDRQIEPLMRSYLARFGPAVDHTTPERFDELMRLARERYEAQHGPSTP